MMFPNGNDEVMDLLDSKKRKDKKLQDRIAELERMHKVDDGIIRLQAKQLADKDAQLVEVVEFIKSGIDEDIQGWHAWERRAREFVAKTPNEWIMLGRGSSFLKLLKERLEE